MIAKFPSFNEWWDSEDNYNVIKDGDYTSAGLCAEFSQFYIDNFDSLDDVCVKELFLEVEFLLSDNKKSSNLLDLSNSLKSCFLENIAQTKAGEKSKKYMGALTKIFFNEWHSF